MSISKVLGKFAVVKTFAIKIAKAILTAIKAAVKKSYTVEMLVKDGVTIAVTASDIIRFKDGGKGIYGYRCIRLEGVWDQLVDAKSLALVRFTRKGDGSVSYLRACFKEQKFGDGSRVKEYDLPYSLSGLEAGLHLTFKGSKKLLYRKFVPASNTIK